MVNTKEYFSICLKMNELAIGSPFVADRRCAEELHLLVFLQEELQRYAGDRLALRFTMARICSNIATFFRGGHPMSIRQFLKTEFSKLTVAYKKLETSEDKEVLRQVTACFYDSVNSIRVIMEQRY